jgi:hypothetical protein
MRPAYVPGPGELQDLDSPSVNTAPAVDIRGLVERYGTVHAVSSGLGVRHASMPLVAEPSLFGRIANRQARTVRGKCGWLECCARAY